MAKKSGNHQIDISSTVMDKIVIFELTVAVPKGFRDNIQQADENGQLGSRSFGALLPIVWS
jgi:hypothetical protein